MDTYKDALSQKLEQDEKTETGTLMETSCFCMQKYCSLVYLLYACLHVWRSVHGLLFCHCQLWSQSGVWNLSTDSWLLITASGQRSAGKATCAYYCLISVLVLMMQAVSADTNINILHNATITEWHLLLYKCCMFSWTLQIIFTVGGSHVCLKSTALLEIWHTLWSLHLLEWG